MSNGRLWDIGPTWGSEIITHYGIIALCDYVQALHDGDQELQTSLYDSFVLQGGSRAADLLNVMKDNPEMARVVLASMLKQACLAVASIGGDDQ